MTFTLANTHDVVATGLSLTEAHRRLEIAAAEMGLALHLHTGGWAGNAISTAYYEGGDMFLNAVYWVRPSRPADVNAGSFDNNCQ